MHPGVFNLATEFNVRQEGESACLGNFRQHRCKPGLRVNDLWRCGDVPIDLVGIPLIPWVSEQKDVGGWIIGLQPVNAADGSRALEYRALVCSLKQAINVVLEGLGFEISIQEEKFIADALIEYLFDIWQQMGIFVKIAAVQKIMPQQALELGCSGDKVIPCGGQFPNRFVEWFMVNMKPVCPL